MPNSELCDRRGLVEDVGLGVGLRCGGGLVSVEVGFVFGWRDPAYLGVEPLVVEPVDVFEGREVDLVDGSPGQLRMDYFSFA